MYYSAYGAEFLAILASKVRTSASSEIWCVFDNTASGAALGNALTISDQLRDGEPEGDTTGCMPTNYTWTS
jgi:uncharacterized protein YecE (DUF72 family)